MSANTIITSVVTGGTNNHSTVAEEVNSYATDFVTPGVVGAITFNSGSGGTGSFCVNADASPDMGVTVNAGQAYISAIPSTQDLQVLRARASANYTTYTINANTSGSTKYDWIYLQVSPTNANVPDAAADNVTAIYTSRSSSNTADNGAPPTYGILLAVVTVANNASSITNGNITDKRTQAFITAIGTASVTGWNSPSATVSYNANNGSKEFVLNTSSDLTATISPGMKFKVTRSTTPPTECMSFVAASSQYASLVSPAGITFTTAFTCEAWVYLTSYVSSGHIISRRDSSNNGWGFHTMTGGILEVYYASAGSFTTFDTYNSLPLNQWVHVAAAVSSVSSKTAIIYINGTAVNSFTNLSNSTALSQGTGPLEIGGYNGANEMFNGYISEVRVWSIAQTQTSIRNNMAINLVGTETNLVALFQGNGNFNDATTNANNLTATNSASATQASNPYNLIEYANVRAINSTTITLYTSDAGTIPNATLNTPQYSITKEPYGLPEILNSKILGKVFWGANTTTTATGNGTPLNGASITLTVPSNGKTLVIKASSTSMNAGAGIPVLTGWWGSIQQVQWNGAASAAVNMCSAPFNVSSGSQTFTLQLYETSAGTSQWSGAANQLAWFTIEEA